MTEQKRNDEIQSANLKNSDLELASGGYGIIHRHDGFKTLIDDKGKKIDKKFMNTYEANNYAREHKEAGHFKRGKEWEEY